MRRDQGKATMITSDHAKGGYAPELRPTPPVLSTPPFHGFLLLLLLLLLISSCTRKPLIPLDVPVLAPVSEVVQVLPEEAAEAPAVEPEELNGVDPAVSMPDEEPVFKAVYFEYNEYDFGFEQGGALSAMYRAIQEHPERDWVLEGHCDIRGSERYNFGLGQKRAASVKRKLGLPGVRIVSYGESRPVREGCVEEDCHAENRRVELRVGR